MDEPRAADAGDVADVTNSTAFLSIDALLEEGKLVEDRAVLLKARYKELHDRVLQIYANDNFLLKRARQCRKDLDAEKAKVEKCGEVALQDNSTIQSLKKDLAAAEHELSIAQEKESMLQVEALELDRKRQTLTHDVEESIAQEERKLKPLIEAHHREIKQLGDDIEATAARFEKLKEEREKLLATEANIKEEMERQNALMYETKMEYARIEREPERARKQADIVVRAAQTAAKEKHNLSEKLKSHAKHKKELEDKKQALSQQQDDLFKSVESNKGQIAQRTKLLDSITTNLEIDNVQGTKYQKRAQELEDLLKAAAIAMNAERDNLQRTIRDKDQGMKLFKKLEQSKADLHNECEMFRKQKDILHREEQQLQQQRKQSARDLEDLKRDVDILINNFLREEISEKRCVADKDQMHKLIRDMEDEVSVRAAEEQQLKRDASALSIKREQMSRDCSRNQGKVQLALSELKVKEVVHNEFVKRLDDLVQRLNSVVEHWHRVKRERSTKAQLIQTNSQTMSETQEKIKILDNELEVLRRESLIKDQELKRREREEHEHRQTCKNLRVERNRWNKKLENAKHKEEDLKRQMTKLNSVITTTEDEMLRLKEAYEDAVENRNYTGIQLIDRNDELCILYEKANIQENILKHGMVQLNQRDEDIRKTAIQLADLQRDIDLCQKILPQVRDLEEDLAELMMQLEEERWRAEVLENDLTDPSNATRWRKIGKVGAKSQTGGPQAAAADAPSDDFVELSEKSQQLEERLAAVNEKLMEKDLILEETTELSNRLRKQALNGRDFTLALAKKVNGYQFGIKNKTKRMMSTLSELSMVQASSIKLEMDVAQAEERLHAARERAEQGLPPSDDVERRFEKELSNTQRRKEVLSQRKAREDEELNSPQGAKSRATRRANAYMEGDSDLMLPKPYGAHAPFAPAIRPNVSRFYRKSRGVDLDFDDED